MSEDCDPVCSEKGSHWVCQADSTCGCEDGWSGANCDNGPPTWWEDNLIILMLGGIVGLVFLLVIVICIKKKQAQKRLKAVEKEKMFNEARTNPGTKLNRPIGRIKAPRFLFQMNYNYIVIGRYNREEYVDLDLTDFPGVSTQYVSRVHCSIFLDEDRNQFMLENHGRHGTYVDKKKLKENDRVRLYDHSMIEIGGAEFLFRDDIHPNPRQASESRRGAPQGRAPSRPRKGGYDEFDDEEKPRRRTPSSQQGSRSRPQSRYEERDNRDSRGDRSDRGDSRGRGRGDSRSGEAPPSRRGSSSRGSDRGDREHAPRRAPSREMEEMSRPSSSAAAGAGRRSSRANGARRQPRDQPLACFDAGYFVFDVYYETCLIGRCSNGGPPVDLDLGEVKGCDTTHISRQHAKLSYNAGSQEWSIESLGRNGTIVDGVRVGEKQSMPLYNRSVLTLGSVDFTFIDKTDMEDEIQPASNPNLAPAPLGYDADRDPAYAQPPPDMV